jgi:hypothetical protein
MTRLADQYIIELGYDDMKGTECFVSFKTIVLITEEFNVMVNSEELIGTTAYLTLCGRCHINRCHLKWIRMFLPFEEAYSHEA